MAKRELNFDKIQSHEVESKNKAGHKIIYHLQDFYVGWPPSIDNQWTRFTSTRRKIQMLYEEMQHAGLSVHDRMAES